MEQRAKGLRSIALWKFVASVLGVLVYSGLLIGVALWLLKAHSDDNLALGLGVPTVLLGAGTFPVIFWLRKRFRGYLDARGAARRQAEFEVEF